MKVERRGDTDWYIFKKWKKEKKEGTTETAGTSGSKALTNDQYREYTKTLRGLGWKCELSGPEKQKALKNDDVACSTVIKQMKESQVSMDGLMKECMKVLNVFSSLSTKAGGQTKDCKDSLALCVRNFKTKLLHV